MITPLIKAACKDYILTTRMSVADFKALKDVRGSTRSKTKYRNTRVQVDGFWFDSKLEAARYDSLVLLRKSGEVRWFICQVPFRLPGGIIYRADFLIVWAAEDCSAVTVEDCKGARTRTSINKIKQVEAIYGIKVQIITRKNVR
jgi:Protein of unknown function (DUF1064)